MGQKLTLNNIKNYLQGNIRFALDNINALDRHIKEQVIFRSMHCADCLQKGKCINCGCSIPGRWYSMQACSDRFPDLMDEDSWEKYKKDNDITIDESSIQD